MTLLEAYARYIGTKEYNGIVAEIQKWYYGYVSKTAWCATSMSYFANECGILDQLGGRNEGVYEMYQACKGKHRHGYFYDYGAIPAKIPEGAVCFFLRNGASHVTVAAEPKKYDRLTYIRCLGGNQDDSICVKSYHMSKLQAIFIPDYGDIKKPTVKKGYKDSERGGTWCVTVQKALNELINAGLVLDGSCGAATESAIKSFQKSCADKGIYTSTIDGRCGPKTWAMIDKLMEPTEPYKVRVETDLNARSGAATTFPVIKVLREGSVYTVDRNLNGWSHLAEVNAWASSKYLTKTG